ncbi:hypothetical protein ACJ72_03135 [Emergomyces africanus]|uniref:CMP/dCMP-type deaminase domain-containing protein n=1 Tax=Emergomyces africanus TaxID=1955775 RepID=A0A1B7P0H5_9EURO|nr:hypothetical protein ACJ72_03135 [Emergomyces africanus]
MGTLDPFEGIQPLRGHVSLLKTVQETRSGKETVEAYVAEINIKSASKVLKLLESKLPKDASLSLTHLRRFVKPEFLPDHLKRGPAQPAAACKKSPQTIYILIPPPLPELSFLETLLAPYAPPILTTTDSSSGLEASSSSPSSSSSEPHPRVEPTLELSPIQIRSTRIPLSPPTTEEESATWSRTLWPTIYNPAAHPITHSPRGPLLLNAQESVSQRAGSYLALAAKVALEAKRMGRGRAVGAVVVDPALADVADSSDEFAGIVVVAGDARFWSKGRGEDGGDYPPVTNTENAEGDEEEEEEEEGAARPSYNPDHEGQPDHHALMRAISLVAYKRLNSSTSPTVTPSISISPSSTPVPISTTTPTSATTFFTEPSAVNPPPPKKPKPSPPSLEPEPNQPTQSPPPAPPPPYPPPTPLESHFLSLPNIQTRAQGGYLCTSLDLYITHEPCVCCAMGMLLSRFRAVVYLQAAGEGRADAALDPYTGYGLHWRQELNWRAVGFRFFIEGEEGGGASKGERLERLGLERGVFHA